MNRKIAERLDQYRRHEEGSRNRKAPFLFPDARVVSFPRSGRSWIKFMTVHVMLNASAKNMRYQGLAMFKHDGASIHISDVTKRFRTEKAELYGDTRVALLVRHPLDVVVSGWHLLRHRMKQARYGKWSLDEYIRLPRGLPFLVRWMNAWANERLVPREFRLFLYEDFLQQPVYKLKEFCEFLGLRDQPFRRYERAVSDFSFENMRSHDYYFLLPGIEHEIKKALDPSKDSSFAVRKGKPGGWREELSEETQAWAVEYIEENLNRFFEVYKGGGNETTDEARTIGESKREELRSVGRRTHVETQLGTREGRETS